MRWSAKLDADSLLNACTFVNHLLMPQLFEPLHSRVSMQDQEFQVSVLDRPLT